MPTIKERYGTVLRIYDLPCCMDRYTILPPRWDKSRRNGVGSGVDPRGMSYHIEIDHTESTLGKRIHWNDLPEAVKNLCRREWPEYTKEM